jgi:hypothetical protein
MRDFFNRNQIENVRYLPLMDIACPKQRCIIADREGAPYYFDVGHLNGSGSRWIARSIAQKSWPESLPGVKQARAELCPGIKNTVGLAATLVAILLAGHLMVHVSIRSLGSSH